MHHQKTLLLFNSLGPCNGKLSGEKARSYLLSSNLPTHSLKTIWDQSDRDKDGQLSYDEFTTAVQLVNQARSATNQAIGMSTMRGMSGNTSWNSNFQTFSQPQQPVYSQSQSLSQSFNLAPFSQPAPFSQQPLTMFSPPQAAFTLPTSNNTTAINSKSAVLERSGSLPGSSASDWAVDANSKKRYIALFNKFDSMRAGSLGGDIAKAEFTKSGLPLHTLGHIWGLADITKTGSLSADEFCVAMHLIENAQRGREPPESLSETLTPPQYRNVIGRERSLTAGHFDTLNKGSLEDKKRANFNKGQAELEKRRLAKLEEERKAKEAAAQAAAAAAEAVRVQSEAEERRRVEFQRQRTRSIEDSVRRAEQENEEKQTIDKSKMVSWAVQRKQQLESQLVRLTDLTTGLRVRRDLLQREHQDMSSRCERARSSLDQYREDTKAILLNTEKLREGRGAVLYQVTVAKRSAMSSQSELSSITNDKVRLSQQLRTLRTVDEVMLTILSDQEKARDSILSLKTEYSHTSAQLDDCQTQMLNCNVAHQEMKSRLQSASEELREKEALLSQLQAMNKERVKQEGERKRRAEEERRRNEERECSRKRIEEAERLKGRKRAEEEQAALVKDRRRIESLNSDLARTAEHAASAAQRAALAQAALVSHQERANLLIEERKKRKAEEMAKAYKKLEEMRANRPSGPPPSTGELVSFSSPSHAGESTLCEQTGEKLAYAQAGAKPGEMSLTGEKQLCEKTGEKLDKPLKRRKKKDGPKSKGGKGKGKKNRPISISLPTTHPDFDPMEGPSAGASLKGLGEPIYAAIHSASPTPDTITESENPYSNTPMVPRKSFIKAPAREKMSYAAAGKEPTQTGEKPQESAECDDLIPDLMSHETPEKAQSKARDVTQELEGLFAVNECAALPKPEEILYMSIDSCKEMLTAPPDPFAPAAEPFPEPDFLFSTPVPEYLTPPELEQQERREQPHDIYMNIDSYRLHPNYQEDDEDDEDDEFLSSSEDDDFYDEEHIYSVAHPKGCNLEAYGKGANAYF